jgi:hypothetical protein
MSVRARVRQRVRNYRVHKLADRDLDAFEAEHRSLIRTCEEAERAFEFASPEEAPARRAAYLQLVERGRDLLAQSRDDRLAELGPGEDADHYRADFSASVLRRLSRFAPELDPPAGDAFGTHAL